MLETFWIFEKLLNLQVDIFCKLSFFNFSDLVHWIIENVEGISDRREARKFIGNMLRKNYIKHTVNKLTFSENSYYQFGEGDGGLLNDDDGNYCAI